MNRYKALLQERANLITEARALLSGADGRDLSTEEAARDDAINARLEKLAGEIDREERIRQQELQAPGVPINGAITGVRDLAVERPFASLGENLRAAVALATRRETSPAYRAYEAHVQQMYAAAGLNEAVGSEGGVLVQTDFVNELLRPMHEVGPFTSRTRNIPVSANANGIVINAIDETSRATGSRWGGVQGYRLAEAQTKTASKPAFRRMELRLKKYAVLIYATDELLQDSSALEAILSQAGGEELSFMANDDIMNGLGVGGPLGILASGAAVEVAKETGQAAATVVYANILKMWSRLHPRHRASAEWYVNAEVEAQLAVMSFPVGTSALEPRFVTYGADGVMRMMGRPVVVTEFNAALGTVGDIVLADLGDYITIDKGGVQAASSIHVEFLTDQTVFRFVYRYDGQPTMRTPLTPYKGSATQSAYVTLATRS